MSTHAKLSPSGAEGWSRCSGWAADPKGSSYADWGTAAHALAERCHNGDVTPVSMLDQVITLESGTEIQIDQDMVDCVQAWLNTAMPGETFVECRLPITSITGEPDSFGTADRVTIADGRIIVDDLKTGMGVRVDAPNNKQLAIYAQAAVEQFSALFDFDTVLLRIVQPRLDHISEWSLTVAELAEFVGAIKPATSVQPGEKQCRWCAKKATCEALRAMVDATVEVVETVTEADDATIAVLLGRLDLIQDWCKAVRAEAEARMFAGRQLPGWKLVAGKAGPRQWADDTAVEALFKRMRLRQDQMYRFGLISPTTAEKLFKEKQPKRWKALQPLITQKSGSPAVVPVTDKRQAIQVAVDPSEFQPVTA